MQNNSIDRRNFLKKLGLSLGGATVVSLLGKNLYDAINDSESNLESIKFPIRGIKDKPIDLGYHPYIKDKKIHFNNMPKEKFHIISRISRCLRWKALTDAVENRYGIPRGLLMAMMAQEGLGDPTMPNLSGDGGLGLIHIQAINAHIFGLKTLPRFTSKMVDRQHGALIKETLSQCNYDMSKLIEHDDRFHPIMAVDCAARFLVDCKDRFGNGTDSWIHALKKYSGRTYWDYCVKVLEYWATINSFTGDVFPKGFSDEVYKLLKNKETKNISVIKRLDNLSFIIDGEPCGYNGYLDYFTEALKNFGLHKYKEMGNYQENLLNK